METPEQRAFARTVLWHLAGLRADVYETQLLVVEILAAQKNESAVTIQAKWAEESAEKRRGLYREGLRAAGLEYEPPPSDSQG
jgi:hypothetical protein